MKFTLNPLTLLHRHRPDPNTEPIVKTPSQAHIIAGRNYVMHIPYSLPKDFPENERLNFQDHFLHAVLGTDILAPLDVAQVRSILDVGCGTERWAHRIARAFPQAQIVGLDAVAPTPNPAAPPLNYHFIKADILQGLPFADESFDYVHQRLLVGGIPAKSWLGVVRELARVAHAFGWVELLEGGETFTHSGPATQQFLTWWRALNTPRGIDASLMAYIDTWLHEAGLKQVKAQTIRVPIGAHGGRAGAMLARNTLAGWSGLKGRLCPAVTTEAAFESIMRALPDEWNANRTSYEYYVAYGQKGVK